MKISTRILVLAYTFSPASSHDNEHLCKDSLLTKGLRLINPTLAGPSYEDSQREHYVIGSPIGSPSSNSRSSKRSSKSKSGHESKHIKVFLPGTGSYPFRHSCIIEAMADSGAPTIGLAYSTLRPGDSGRNALCGGEPDTAQCLEDQHLQAILGGDYRSNLWPATSPFDSITGRLGMLLKYLDENHPNEGWCDFYHEDGGDIPTPYWKKIVVVGFSQGAGHGAYMAQWQKLAGVGLLSGPQDECIDCPKGTKLWVDNDYKTYAITGMAHGSADPSLEPLLPVIKDNWSRMKATGTISWSHTKGPLTVTDIGTGLDGHYGVCEAPIVSFLKPSDTTSCGRAGHCSMALDNSTPLIESTNGDKTFIYALHAWPEIANAHKCK